MNNVQTSQPFTVSIAWQPAFDEWLSGRKLNQKSKQLAAQHVRVFSLWYAAQFNQTFDPQSVTNYDFVLYRAWSLNQEKVKAATWNSRLWAFGILCTWIGDQTLLEDVEGKDFTRLSTKHRSLSADEYHRLIHALEQNLKRTVTAYEYQNAVRNWASVMVMLHGLRVEEASELAVGDITLNERSGAVLVRDGKGGKERTVPINLIGRKALRLWLDVRPASATNNLFGVSKRTLQRGPEALGAQIGVADLTCHWLRYTFAKRLERNGTPLSTICQLTGHSSIESLQRYLRSSAEELQSAVEGVM